MKFLYLSNTKSGMVDQGIYFDLMQEIVKNGHEVVCVYANEKRNNEPSIKYVQNGIQYYGVKTGNLTKNKNLISKGLATLAIDSQFVKAIKDQYNDETFDVVLYSTPPITFTKTLTYLKEKGVFTYLMLKDIFPQNAVDLNMFTKNGLIHKFFMKKESRLYDLSEAIGVMSPANKAYLIKHFPSLEPKIHILPNSIALNTKRDQTFTKSSYGVSDDDLLLLYGGNVGAPQGPDFIKECILALEKLDGVKLIIVGSGSHMDMIQLTIHNNDLKNTQCIAQLPVDKYNGLVSACDVGLIFLDYRFTIPNYPQRLLSYLNENKPVICATDEVSDIGSLAQENNYGIKVSSNNVDEWINAVTTLKDNAPLRQEMGVNGKNYLETHYDVKKAYEKIMETLKENHNV